MSKILTIDALNKTLKALNGGELTSTIKKGQVKRVGDRIYRAKKDITNFNERDVLDSTKFKPTYIGDGIDSFKVNIFSNQLELYKAMYYENLNGHRLDNSWDSKRRTSKTFKRTLWESTTRDAGERNESSSTSFSATCPSVSLPSMRGKGQYYYRGIGYSPYYHFNFTREPNEKIKHEIDYVADKNPLGGTNTYDTDRLTTYLRNDLKNINDKEDLYNYLTSDKVNDEPFYEYSSDTESYETRLFYLNSYGEFSYNSLKKYEAFDFVVFKKYSITNLTNSDFIKLQNLSPIRISVYRTTGESEGNITQGDEKVGSYCEAYSETTITITNSSEPLGKINSLINSKTRFWLPYMRDIDQYDYSSNSARKMNESEDNNYGVGLIAKQDGYYRLNFKFIKTNKQQHDENYWNDRYAYIPGNRKITGTGYSYCEWQEGTKYDGYIKFKCENGQISDVEFNCGDSRINEFFRYSKVDNHIFIQVFYAIWSYDDNGQWNEWQFAHLIAPFKLYYSPTPILNNEMEAYDEISLQQ